MTVILVSSLDTDITRAAGQQTGARSFFGKPVHFARLTSLVDDLLCGTATCSQQTQDLQSIQG